MKAEQSPEKELLYGRGDVLFIKKIVYPVVVIAFLFFPNISQAKLFSYESYTLDNGLRVILYNADEGADVVSQTVFYDAGGMDDFPGKSGVAHFLEHLMFKGDNANFSSNISKLGGDNNAFTTQDCTAYYQVVSSNRLEDIIALESVRMGNLSFSQEEFETEKKVVQQERLMRYEMSPKAKFLEKLSWVFWMGHPYGVPVIGRKEEFMHVEEQDVKDFYNKFYAPNNAILVISGKFDKSKAKKLIEKYYGHYAAREIEKKPVIAVDNRVITKTEEENASVGQGIIYMMYSADSIGLKMHDDYKNVYALMMNAHILGGSKVSMLYRRLVNKKELAIDVSVSYQAFNRSNGVFVISIIPKADKFAEEIINIVSEEMKTIAKKGVSEKELAVAKETFLADIVYAKEDVFSIANWLGKAALLGYDINEIEIGIKRVAVDDTKSAMHGILEGDSHIVGVQKGAAK